jgi:hypothetical protein
MAVGRAASRWQRSVDDTDDRTGVGRCFIHGKQTAMLVRGRWRFVCCGRRALQVRPHPVSVLEVPFFDESTELLR